MRRPGGQDDHLIRPGGAGRCGDRAPGREFLQAIIDGRLPPPPIANLFGAELVAVGDGEALFRCTPDHGQSLSGLPDVLHVILGQPR
jgi:hypothetical protein